MMWVNESHVVGPFMALVCVRWADQLGQYLTQSLMGALNVELLVGCT